MRTSPARVRPCWTTSRRWRLRGVEILTCGTCLNFYGLTEKLAVGGVTNMYVIAEKMLNAGNVVKP